MTTARGRRGRGGRRPGVVPPRPTAPGRTDGRDRLVALLVVLALAFTGVAVRLVLVQGVHAGRYALFGRSQRLHTVVLPPERGAILDRNGAALAISSRRRTVWADPKVVRDPAGAAHALAPVLHLSEPELRSRLSANAAFVYLARKVEDSVADRVAALHLDGVSLLEEPKRVDPAAPLASSVLGQVGLDDEGLSGLELQFQGELAGRPGQVVVERDPGGRDIASGSHQLRPPARGAQITLTLDRSLQYEAEQALADQIATAKAKGGIAIVMDVATGEILAMANLRVAAGHPEPSPDNMALTAVYEPGSVNKLVTIAAALEEGVVRPDASLDVPDHLAVADSTFHDSHPHATQSMSVGQIVAESSNVGTILIGQRLGKDRVDRYLRGFGLAQSSGLGFPGESSGLLPDPRQWSGTSIATLPIGQGVAVTALQMLLAYNTVANGGVYVQPTLVKQIVGSDGRTRTTRRAAPRRVVSAPTAAALTTMLQGVVQDGTGTAARVSGFSVAGKTGTAEKPLAGARGYKPGAYVASFAGFVPARSPRLSAIVVLDEPTPIFGGVVSAPVFSRLAGYGLRLLGVAPDVPAGLPAAAGAAVASPPASLPTGGSTLGRSSTSRP